MIKAAVVYVPPDLSGDGHITEEGEAYAAFRRYENPGVHRKPAIDYIASSIAGHR